MISKKGNASGRVGMLPAVIIGTVAALFICSIAVFTGPILFLNEYLEPKLVHIIAMIVHGIGTFLGTIIAGTRVNEKKWVVVSATAGLFYVVLICGGVMFFESATGTLLAGLLSCAAGAVLSLLLLNRKSTRNQKRIKRRSR